VLTWVEQYGHDTDVDMPTQGQYDYAQRQAALDLITAQHNLATAKANPDSQNPANATALAQVQLAADQAKQNVQDLSDAGSQLQ